MPAEPEEELSPREALVASAAEAMEQEDWTGAMALLVALLGELEPGQEALEATSRALLAQCLVMTEDLAAARAQAQQAQRAAEQSGRRDVIHRCMALVASLNIMENGRL
jgi:thioredoxin-like negative regulator of GroEL